MEQIATRDDDWSELKKYTNARIALGMVGKSLPTKEILQFGLSHALAKDAVLRPFDISKIRSQLDKNNINSLIVESQASDRKVYLENPNLGRVLHEKSKQFLKSQPPHDLAVIIADGLSTEAVHKHAVSCVLELKNQLQDTDFHFSSVVLASQSRVALGDDIAESLRSKASLIFIGERPGLSSPDSLGCYFTWNPRLGCSDANRNCVSNINAQGLSYVQSASKIKWLLLEAQRIGCSGIFLKDRAEQALTV
jgi:ethanolamine ammonia-lyase small subunit